MAPSGRTGAANSGFLLHQSTGVGCFFLPALAWRGAWPRTRRVERRPEEAHVWLLRRLKKRCALEVRRRAGWRGAEKREGAQDHALGIEKERGLYESAAGE